MFVLDAWCYTASAMKAIARIFLLLLICLALPLYAGAAASVPAACDGGQAQVAVASMATSPEAVVGDCQSAMDDHAPALGALCKLGAVCALTLAVLPAGQSLVPSQDLRAVYSREPILFVLQDFPQTLLRPPRLV